MKIILVNHMDQVLEQALGPKRKRRQKYNRPTGKVVRIELCQVDKEAGYNWG